MTLLESLHPINVLTWTATVVAVYTIFRLWKRKVDPADLIIGDDGKLSWTKLLGCTGGVVFTYGFLHLVATGNLGEWYFNGFGLICFGTAFAYKLNALKLPATQTTTVNAPSDSQVKVDVQPHSDQPFR